MKFEPGSGAIIIGGRSNKIYCSKEENLNCFKKGAGTKTDIKLEEFSLFVL